MKTVVDGARQLPVGHISIRVPWHDGGWEGTVCRRPRENTACLILKNVAERKDDAAEEACSGAKWSELAADKLPACVTERASFMASFEFTRITTHPYAKSSDLHKHFAPTPFRHPAYSAACVPFGWMLRGGVEGDEQQALPGLAEELQLDFRPEREPDLPFETAWVQDKANQLVMLDTFFSAVRPEESLCFLYAKRTPLSEERRRVIVGVGRVLAVGDAVEYKYATPKPPLRCVLWERNVTHSIRPGFADGFLFPYREILALAERDDTLDPADFVAFAPAERFDEFSYGSAHVSHDAAIDALLACVRALRKTGERVPGPWDQALQWIDRELNRLWKMRGPFPGFGSALTAFGIPHGNLLAHAIAAQQARRGSERNEDPWPLFERALENPGLLGREMTSHVGASFKKQWARLTDERRALLKLLSRFELSAAQATRYYQPTERAKAGIETTDKKILANPYVLYELDRTGPDPVSVTLVDRGMLPDPIVRQKHPMPKPSALGDVVDARRVRALVVDELERAAQGGHTLQRRDSVIQAVRDRELRPQCPLSVDVLAVAEDHFAPHVDRVLLGDQTEGYQLDRLVVTRRLINEAVEKRLKGRRHEGKHDWRTLLDRQFGPVETSEDPEEEERARQEKVAALAELFASRISVLIGPAGTGKTTLLSMLCRIPEINKGGVLLLAPTGKARVRLESQTERKGGRTIAQFLLALDRYDPSTGRYFVTGAEKKAAYYRTVIIDECSMLTEEQLAAVIDALRNVERLILVGDPRQLPPIGTGRPLLDIVRRHAPPNVENVFPRVGQGYAELTIPRRQAGAKRDDLVLAQWFSGQPPDPGADEVWDRVERGESRYVIPVEWNTPEELERRFFEELVRELGLTGLDDEDGFEQKLGGEPFKEAVYFSTQYRDRRGAAASVEDWQILSPVRVGPHGVDSLNRVIQQTFRRRAFEWAEPDAYYNQRVPKPFGPQRIIYGDKVISVVNERRRRVWPKPDELPYIANGDLGIAVGQYKGQNSKIKWPKLLEVEFLTHQGLRISYFPSEFGEDSEPPLELAYALTVHKTQGSEFRLTFVVLPNPCRLLSRELLYTALTRQQDRLVILHQGPLREFRKYSGELESEVARRLTNLFEPPRPILVEKRFLDERLIHKTRRGDLVRSKSEVIVADLLYAKGLKDKYYYELEVLGPDGTHRYPDFTIIDDELGITVFWEHLGMMDDPAYRERWARKLEWYRRLSVVPYSEGQKASKILVITRDDEKGGVDVPAIEKLVDSVLG